jgi:hypothetical protein
VKEQKADSWKRQKVVLKFGNEDRGKWQAILANAVLQPTRKAACWLRERSRRAAEQRCYILSSKGVRGNNKIL